VGRKASFTCQLCGKEAGSIGVIDNDHVRLHGLYDRTMPNNFRVFKAIDNSDACALYKLDDEYVPLYCPQCDCFYCAIDYLPGAFVVYLTGRFKIFANARRRLASPGLLETVT
jgi:hypothetical protein